MSFNGTMYHNESTIQRAFIPLYKVQTTADLAKNASADDVEAALEAITACCTVDVTRSLVTTGYSWSVTFTAQSSPVSLEPMLANRYRLAGETTRPNLDIVTVRQLKLSTPVTGVPYTARVSAINVAGTGPSESSSPVSLQPADLEPGPPQPVLVDAVSHDTLKVSWSRDGR